MKRTDWDALTEHERREWAIEWGEGRRCIERTDGSRCLEPAGTPWGKHWCAHHDDERLARISDGLHSIQLELHKRRSD